jgi:hypothetical protein
MDPPSSAGGSERGAVAGAVGAGTLGGGGRRGAVESGAHHAAPCAYGERGVRVPAFRGGPCGASGRSAFRGPGGGRRQSIPDHSTRAGLHPLLRALRHLPERDRPADRGGAYDPSGPWQAAPDSGRSWPGCRPGSRSGPVSGSGGHGHGGGGDHTGAPGRLVRRGPRAHHAVAVRGVRRKAWPRAFRWWPPIWTRCPK